MSPTLQIAWLRTAYRDGALTPVEVAETVLRRVEACPDPAVWISRVTPAELRARAAALAADPAARELPLYGVPFAVKDNIDVDGMVTTAGCPAFGYRPQRNAGVVRRLLAAGAMLVGKTNLDQFATGLVGTRSPYGAPRCVFDRRMVAGGSSSGSAVAVAAGLVSFALGTDTAGSGRVPAAFNNIVGIKPTRGLLSTDGVVPACRSLDCVSILAAGVGDGDAVRRVAEGLDEADPWSRSGPARPLPGAGLRVGVLAPADRAFGDDGEAAALYDAAVGRLAALGGEAVAFDFAPFREAAGLLYDGALVAERLAPLRGFMAVHAGQMDPTVRAILEGAAGISGVDLVLAQHRIGEIRHATAAAWRRFDVMLLPTTPTIVSVEAVAAEPVRLNSLLGTYTNFVNLLDLCAVAVPAGFRAGGLPFGVTLVAPAFADAALAVLADRLHRSGGAGGGLAREMPVASVLRPPDAQDPDTRAADTQARNARAPNAQAPDAQAPDGALLEQARRTGRAIGLGVPASCAPGVVANLGLLQHHVDRLMSLDLPEHLAVAPVFRP